MFLCGSAALAYSAMPARGHAVLSNIAVDVFNQCVEQGYGEPGYRLNETERKQIVNANRNEDRTRPLRRILNWHFYNPQMESSQRVFFLINRSFIPLFKGIEARLSQTGLYWKDPLHAIGRAIHFMEDSTVLAHSVPVFHGAGIHDAYEVFPSSGTPSSKELTAQISSSLAQVCSRLSSPRFYRPSEGGLPGEPLNQGSLSLRDILDRTRSFTLSRLDSRVCDKPDSLPVSWQHFWVRPQPSSYFGAYREGQAFGEVSVITENGLSCEITAAKYRESARLLHLEAVFADVRALYWFSRRYVRH